MLAFDWRYTLADNDLPKVEGAAALAGMAVGFPLLDDELVEFSLRLAPRSQGCGACKLRWFFKEALRGFLPDEILRKKKHGFGLPFGVWCTTHRRLRELAFDSVRALGERGIVRPAFVQRLVDENICHSIRPITARCVWILMMLEQWLARRQGKGAL